MQNFKKWIEDFNPQTPNVPSQPAAGSAEVKRTNLQPQVDAQDTQTKGKAEQDKILAVDGELERIDNNLPEDSEDSPKMDQFKQLWNRFKKKWDNIKMSDDPKKPAEAPAQLSGLGNAAINPAELEKAQANPNQITPQFRG